MSQLHVGMLFAGGYIENKLHIVGLHILHKTLFLGVKWSIYPRPYILLLIKLTIK